MFMIQAIGENATPSELARCLFRKPHSISELVDRMGKRGLVRKVSNLDRKNQVRVELTDKGREIYNQSDTEEPIHRIMSTLSEAEHQQLRALLGKLWNQALEELDMDLIPPFPTTIRNLPFTNRDFETWIILAQTRRAMFSARSKGLLPFGISPRQAALMFMIRALSDKAKPSELARCLFLEPHSTSELLDRTEEKGLTMRVNDLVRKNQVRVGLTEKGREVYNQSVKGEAIHKIMSTLSGKEHQQLRALLQKLWYKSLEELSMERRPPFPE